VASFASLGIALYYSWKLTLLILVTFPVAAIVLYLVSSGLAPAIEAQKRELSRASKHANTAVTAIDTVKSFNGQNEEIWQYSSTIKKVATWYLVQARSNALQFGITKFLIVGLFVQGFWFGLYLVDQGVDPGHVLTTFYACLSGMQAVEVVLPQWLVLAKGMSAGATLKSIMIQMQNGRRVTRMGGFTKPKACSGDIEMNNVGIQLFDSTSLTDFQVSFAYPSNTNQLVLDNVSFFFPAGETSFVVGTSGSGKSTIGNLLMKYYEPLSGEILIDGNSIKTLDSDWLRQKTTLVQQESVLFNETILQNIAFGRRDQCSREDVQKASATGCLEETIYEMPEGLDTLVGSDGRSLSGGQKQRVAIARARLRDAPIVILDESTSALDHTSKIEVMQRIRDWRKGKTTIIITHDVSQILDDDYVYVLDHAKVVQEGYRNKLADKSHGTFASILRSENLLEDTQRRRSEPATPTYAVETVEEDFTNRWGYISKVFSTPPRAFASSFRNSHMSIGVGVAQANALRSSFIWSSDVMPASPVMSDFKQPISFMSPRVVPQRPSPALLSVGMGYTPSIGQSSFTDRISTTSRTRLKPLTIDTTAINSGTPMIKPRSPGYFIPHDTPPRKAKEEGDSAPASLTRIFSTIWPMLASKDRAIFVLGFIAAFLVAASTPAFAYVFSQLLNVFYLPEDERASQGRKWALYLLAVAVVDGCSCFCTHYALEHSAQSWINSLRLEAFKRILAQPKSWFDKESNSPSRINECLDRNAEEMRNLVGRFAGLVFTVVWMLGISVVWSFIISWKLTLVALACGPIMYAVTRTFNLVSNRWEDRCNKAAGFTSSIFTETFSNVRVIRALTLESYFERKHRRATIDAYNVGSFRALYSGLLFGITDAVSYFVTALIFYYGTVIISDGSHTLGSIIEVVNLLLFGISNSSSMLSMVPQINSSRTTATQMLRLASLPLGDSYETHGTTRLSTPFPIQMNNLSFTHPMQQNYKTLDRISLRIEAGSFTAIVGPSGSGKTTIASILLGLYPPDTPFNRFSPPSLTFSGTSVTSCNISSLRSIISLVPQTPLLFPTSVLNNITYGLPESSIYKNLDSAQRAASQAGIHDFICSLGAGYNTLLGEGGMGISGGQAQRIAIARALVRRPKCLILDECTSALDGEAAEGIREVVLGLVKGGVSVVAISHSTEMMRIADTVIVVEAGRVVEEGGFEELRCRGGALARLIGEGGRESFGLGLGNVDRLMTPVKGRAKESWIRKTSL
jgi:ATP-binding cassette subfamily B (MDR/TAP) protein 1